MARRLPTTEVLQLCALLREGAASTPGFYRGNVGACRGPTKVEVKIKCNFDVVKIVTHSFDNLSLASGSLAAFGTQDHHICSTHPTAFDFTLLAERISKKYNLFYFIATASAPAGFFEPLILSSKFPHRPCPRIVSQWPTVLHNQSQIPNLWIQKSPPSSKVSIPTAR